MACFSTLHRSRIQCMLMWAKDVALCGANLHVMILDRFGSDMLAIALACYRF